MDTAEKPSPDFLWVLLLLTLGGLALRMAWILSPAGALLSDEAVFGLMSLHIWRGEEWPVFCWGAHYAGAVVSYLAAPLVGLIGPTDAAMKSATLPWSAGFLLLGGLWGTRRGGHAGGILVALLLALPVPVFFTFSVMAHGGYPETFFLATAFWTLLLSAEAEESPAHMRRIWLLAGFVAGLGAFILWLILPFLAAGLAAVFFSPRRHDHARAARPAGFSFALGLSPLILYNVVHPLASFRRAAGRSLGATMLRTPLDSLSDLGRGLAELFAPWGGWIGLLAAAVVLAWAIYLHRNEIAGRLLAFFLLFWIPFAAAAGLARARHWTPLYLATVLALPLLPRRAAAALGAAAIVANAYALPSAFAPAPDRMEWVEAALEAKGIRRALAGYEVAYSLTYRTGERIIASPAAGPNRTDRYPAYTEAVLAAPRVALILPDEEARLWRARGGRSCGSEVSNEGLHVFFPEMPPKEILRRLE